VVKPNPLHKHHEEELHHLHPQPLCLLLFPKVAVLEKRIHIFYKGLL
jgi:hypothetical protein